MTEPTMIRLFVCFNVSSPAWTGNAVARVCSDDYESDELPSIIGNMVKEKLKLNEFQNESLVVTCVSVLP